MSGSVLVVGGGPAGAALAIRLAQTGREAIVVERERAAHDKVCGEFLSWEAVAELRSLGVDPRGLGAVPVETVAVAHRRRSAERPLPFEALSLSRRVLDEALLCLAERAGARVRRGSRVVALTQEGATWRARLDDGSEMRAGEAVLATGKHDLRGWRRGAGRQDDLVGFKLHWALAPDQASALRGRVELFLFDGGYAGLEPVEDGRANLCLLVRRARLAALGGGWPALIQAIRRDAPLLDRRLAGAAPGRDRPLAIAGLPYGYVARRAGGLRRLGDQAAVIPSFAGDGLAIALHSARMAAESLLSGEGAEAFQQRLRRRTSGQVLRALWISRALTRPWMQPALVRAAAACPSLLGFAAGATRLPASALPGAHTAMIQPQGGVECA